MQQTGLARIIVIAPDRRMEMTVPEHVPLAGILPTLLRHAGPTLAEDGVERGGWILRRVDGRRLDSAQSLAMQDVLDGETLVLSPNDATWPEPAFDDVAEAIAHGASGLGAQWSPHATLRVSRGFAAAVVVAGAAALLTGPASPQAGTLALVGAAVLLGAAAFAERVLRDPRTARVADALTLLYAVVGALLLGSDGDTVTLNAWSIAGAAGALLFVSLVGQLLLPGVTYVAGSALAVGAGAITLLAATSLTTVEGAAAVVVGLVVLSLFALPRLAMSIGGVPTPAVPSITGEVEGPPPPAAELSGAVRRSDELLTGLLLGTMAVVAAGLVLLADAHTTSGLLLVGAVTLICALRARAFAASRHRVALISAAITGLLSLVWYAWTGPMRAPVPTALLVTALLVLALSALALGHRLSRRAFPPRLGRLGDLLSLVLTAAVPVLVGLVLGLFGFFRGLGG
ncbi:type VII secretion system ESX-4 subunit EccD4 [Micromonospora polyrhachis]|uniref:Type VII secretion integral membrane protein EccD n=1 Tax=Micromonospora polyrhachis TaxID=1282883 RepID=A0A7W7SLV8_9ACTN|nr:type VII secretion integral membrane protein EccD [Micromonospora polyrhachis]MBB4957129.1 type VII secretion integral membrane protein EccD [Micromonospora polyrhachis]